MNTKTKKGFTLTELIIVVVIIGILAAVLIPTLTACVKKAKISNDKQLVRNLNLALSTDSLANRDGEKHKNMQEALDAAEIAGYIVDRINATKADNEILWDSKNDVFCYLNDGKIEYIPSSVASGDELDDDNPVHAVKLWQIVKLTSGDLKGNRFSVYAAPGSDINPIITNKGFDAGTLQFPSVSYDRTGEGEDQNGHQVIIRTNSAATTLTINAENDNVKHFDAAGSVDVIAVASASYHEYGKVAFMEVAKGRVALEAKSEVNQIHISTKVTNVDDAGNKTKEENVFDSIIIALDNSVEMPTFSRDAVSEINPNGTLVVALQEGTEDEDADKDYVWLYQQGVIQQMVVTTTTTFDADSKATAYAETSNTFKAADDIANNFTGSNTWENVSKDENGNITTSNATADSGLSNEEMQSVKTEVVNEAKVIELEEKQASCVHEFDDDGVCTKCGYQEHHYECRIGDVYYEELKDAIEALATNGTIVLVNNIETMSPMATRTAGAVPFKFDDKTVNIDLNGYTIQLPNSYVTMWGNGTNTAKLNILDTSDGQNGKFLFGEASWGHIYNMKLTVYGGYYNIDVNDYISPEYEVNKTADVLYKVEPSVVVENTLGQNNDGDYLVYNLQDLTLVSKLVKQGVEDFDEKTIKLMSDIDLSKVYWTMIGFSSGRTFKGTLDGNGKTITLGDSTNLFGYLDNSTIENLNVFFDNSSGSHIAYSTDGGTAFNNVDVSGIIHFYTGNQAAYVVYPDGNLLSFTNCDSSLTIVGTGDDTVYIAVYMGYPRGSNMTIQFDSCIHTGSISSGRAALYMANGSYDMGVDLILNNCANNGVVQYFADISDYPYSNEARIPNYYYAQPADRPATLKSVTIDGTTYTSWWNLPVSAHPGTGTLLSYQASENLSIALNSDNTFTITPSNNENVAYYTITVGTYFAVPNGSSRYYVSETLTIDGTSAVSSIKNIQFVDSEWKETHSSALLVEPICGNKVYSLNDTLYYYLDYEGGFFSDHLPHNPEMITVSGYSSEGLLLCAASYK